MKSFSWTLALRYLNPLRAFVSVITLLSLLGVAFGVMVLIVVLSVHGGFEQNLKEMLLGFNPHVRVESAYRQQGMGLQNYEELGKQLEEMPGVEEAFAFVEGVGILDHKGWSVPVNYRGVDTASEKQIEALQELLEDGTLELEMAPRSLEELEKAEQAGETSIPDGGVVISRQMADQQSLIVGDEVRLLASTNLDAVIEAYKGQEGTRLWEQYPAEFQKAEELRGRLFEKTETGERAKTAGVTALFRALQGFLPELNPEAPEGRALERNTIRDILTLLDDPRGQEGEYDLFEEGTEAEVAALFEKLRTFDVEKADLEGLKEVRDFVLPKQLRVTGIYHDVKRAQGPGVFVSLSMAQELKGLEPGGIVGAMGLRTVDPYQATETAARLQEQLGPDFRAVSWMETHATQFALVKTEKVMMSFALSFITLLSAFSITAVMYTMTVQKRKEIGVMKALGARPSQIVNVFLIQGVIVGVVGSLLGVVLGLLAVRFRQAILEGLRTVGVDVFPVDFHGMTEIPALVQPGFLIVITLVSIVLCVLAALVPALLAAFRDPAKSLRNL